MGGQKSMIAEKDVYPLFDRIPRGPELRGIYTERLNSFTSSNYADINLSSALYKERIDKSEVLSLKVYSVPNLQRPLFKEATEDLSKFKETHKGEAFGPSWSTHWFQVTLHMLPDEWKNEERVQIEFDLPECLVYSEQGEPLQGLTGGHGGDRRVEFILSPEMRNSLHQGNEVIVYIETSMNGMFGLGEGSQINPPNPNRYFTLDSADLVVPRMDAWRLFWDFWIIKDIAKELPQDGWESHAALVATQKIMNTFDAEDLTTIATCREIAADILGPDVDTDAVFQSSKAKGEVNITAVGKSCFPSPLIVRLTSSGHCHIDTAWLWPFAETRRKIARSWSTQVDLMRRYPEFTFTCSQAQQFKWLSQDYPKGFENVAAMVKRDSFEPIGGTWVEMDTNIPSGEALVRQFLFGQKYFEKNFGKKCDVFWLPDTFGYSAQLPQLSRLAGMKYFFTQKLSWNNINDFPHSTFNWQALDGTQVICHMAPDETYTAQADLGDVLRSEKQHKSLSSDRNSLLVYGNGDGGGGPLAPMVEKLRRCRGASDKKAPSLPRVNIGVVTKFFEKIEKDSLHGKSLKNWSGELYFELHRGTYTSQALTKFYNRTCERLLHDIEYFGSLAIIQSHSSSGTFKFPKAEVDRLWEDVLLCQFHDVLPGSCIEMVYQDAHRIHQTVLKRGKELLESVLRELGVEAKTRSNALVALNTLPWHRSEVLEHQGKLITANTESGSLKVEEAQGNAEIQDLGDGHYKLSNATVSIMIEDGTVTSFYDHVAERELIPRGAHANQLLLYEDAPLYWQAWDVEIFHLDRKPKLIKNGVSKILSTNCNRVSIQVEYQISSKSSVKSTISLDSSHTSAHILKQLNIACEVDWHENKKFLKVEFPTTLVSSQATYETQFGLIKRPTHFNTTWDEAKFEVCCHRFADLSEYNYGLSILNDSKYGFATQGNIMRLSLLRAPKAPDAHADIGKHYFKYAMLAHSSGLEASNVVRKGLEFNSPLQLRAQSFSNTKLLDTFRLDDSAGLILDTVKPAEMGDGIVLRVYESLGGLGRGHITLPQAIVKSIKSVHLTNLLEDSKPSDANYTKLSVTSKGIKLELRAFEVQTVYIKL